MYLPLKPVPAAVLLLVDVARVVVDCDVVVVVSLVVVVGLVVVVLLAVVTTGIRVIVGLVVNNVVLAV